MKKLFKPLIVWVLWRQVARLRAKYNPLVIAVAGSIGKTGTKRAIATVLSEGKKVQWEDGNYNDIVSVPLIFFGQKMPSLLNPVAWLIVFIKNEMMLRGEYPYDVVVVEVGSDYYGNLDEFIARLKVDYGVLTGISAEHMMNFADLDAVAEEESKIAQMSEQLLVNADQVDQKYLKQLPKTALTYGEGPYDCVITPAKISKELKRPVKFTIPSNKQDIRVLTRMIGRQNLPGMAAATLLGSILELTKTEIEQGLSKVQPFSGRMQLLLGKRQSLIIDDTYNSSPDALKAALQTLYELPGTSKIAILGQMNELGDFSAKMHTDVGTKCDPSQLDLLITLGQDANSYLAEAAEKNGCKVVRCPSPYHAGDVALPLLKKGTVVLAKGSQNRGFTEEAVKVLLHSKKDYQKLVRQSSKWLQVKEKQFKHD